MRLPATDINAVLWLGEHSPSSFFVAPGFGGWLGETAYILGGYDLRVGDYLFYEGLTPESIDKLARRDALIVPRSSLMHFEKTNVCYYVPEMFKLLIFKLSGDHNLVYSSGGPFVTIWLRG